VKVTGFTHNLRIVEHEGAQLVRIFFMIDDR
jgi:hypothetical protein